MGNKVSDMSEMCFDTFIVSNARTVMTFNWELFHKYKQLYYFKLPYHIKYYQVFQIQIFTYCRKDFDLTDNLYLISSSSSENPTTNSNIDIIAGKMVARLS